MPMTLEGGCRCGAVGFTVESHTPHPYQRCYCRICRKTAGGGGYAINIMGTADSFAVTGRENVGLYHAEIDRGGVCETSSGERYFCVKCASALWVADKAWPDLVHPFASAIDTDLPQPPSSVHLMLKFKASWVVPQLGENDQCFDEYPVESIEDWHRSRGLWVD